jgi:hypothetical protein
VPALPPCSNVDKAEDEQGATWRGGDRIEAFIENSFDSRGQLSLNSVCVPQSCGSFMRIYPIKPQFSALKVGYDFK